MRKGSALLVVLGMLTFMLFSGLAFSIYMRQARLPSSFIRRVAMTRQLTKAALAEAMAEIDYSIGNYPHPGVFDTASVEGYRDRDGKSGNKCYNTWYRRVFLGAGADTGRMATDPQNELRSLLVNNFSDDPADMTVSTITLEGLAYLPPCLINEARVYSRRTPTAKWAPFAFEAGRYAYTAVDVSDFFDVNRVPAKAHRSSAGSTRITLAHVFEKGEHSDSGGTAVEAYDSRAKSRDAERYPFISLADWNLAMDNTTMLGAYPSPFMDYIRGKAAEPCAITDDEDEESPKVSAYRAMTFVTDSLFTEDASGKKDIEKAEFQPFESDYLEDGAERNLGMFLMQGEAAGRRGGGGMSQETQTAWTEHYCKFMSRIGMAALLDYLDEDSVPSSLTIPTCEKVPMICAMRPEVRELTVAVKKLGDPTRPEELHGPNGTGTPPPGTPVDGNREERDVSCWFLYQLDSALLNSRGGGKVNVMTLFPFLRNEDGGSFTIDGQCALYFTQSGNANDVPLVAGARNDSKLRMEKNTSFGLNDGIINLRIKEDSIDVPHEKKVPGDSDVKKTKVLQIDDFGNVANLLPTNTKADEPAKEACIVRFLRQWKQSRTQLPSGGWTDWAPQQPPPEAAAEKLESKFKILDQNGLPVDLKGLINTGPESNGKYLELNLAVWLRVKDGSGARGSAVDMVPAWAYDDTMQGVGSTPATVYQRIRADGLRIMRFKFVDKDTNKRLLVPLSIVDLDQQPSKTVTLDAPTLVCPDPRYNHHPRNWLSDRSHEDVQEAWEANSHFADQGRDGDYYMSVSNQGYLQSIYEMAFLPRILSIDGDDILGDLRCIVEDWYDFPDKDEFSQCLNAEHMWRTCSPFAHNGMKADDFDLMGLTSGSNGQKVNPFSDSPAVISAAFANTPLDWRAAGTNYQSEASIGTGHGLDKVDKFNSDYAWNEYNGDAKLPWFDGVMELAKRFQSEMRSCKDIDEWEDVYGSLWDGNGTDPKRLMGVELEEGKFTSVDRKFFYGFWHDCFGVQQQLFLIFVRAEPMMMGGGVAGVSPPQLASRAVALVWRDPRPTNKDPDTGKAKPHKMRILFYHPLE